MSPGSVTLADKGQQQFQATGLDQFGQKMASQPNNYTWSIAGGGVGSINNTRPVHRSQFGNRLGHGAGHERRHHRHGHRHGQGPRRR